MSIKVGMRLVVQLDWARFSMVLKLPSFNNHMNLCVKAVWDCSFPVRGGWAIFKECVQVLWL